jgi:2-polyprenyl-6-methoxyphenol hydroxylase-like FAD-dependent oxidoreductase
MSVIRPVLIVGAGLTGLTAAIELSRLGVPVRLIDKRPGPSAIPRTLVIHSLTAELFQQRGLKLETLPASSRVTRAAIYRKGGLLGTAELAPDRDHRGHVLLVCQAEMESLLLEQLGRQDVAVDWDTEMIALAQAERGRWREPGGSGVSALLRHPGSGLEDIAASYVISADGVQGTTGHLLDLPSYDKLGGRPYALADVRLDGDFRADLISVFLGGSGFVMLLPGGGGRFGCVATDPCPHHGGHGAPGMAELQQLFDGCLPAPGRLRSVRWSSRYLASPHLSPVLRHGRVFFGGDSAYAYSPAMGQSANSGIQDMINLGWKLAVVLQEKAAPDLLATYAEERLQAIYQLERRCEVPAKVLGSSSPHVRKLGAPIALAFHYPPFWQDLSADLAGEVIPDYWSSPLSAPPRGPGGLRPGGSVPDMWVFASDPGAPAGTHPRAIRLHELVSPSRLSLLLTDDTGAGPSARHQQQLEPWRKLLAVHMVAPVPDHEERLRFFRCFCTQSLVLVRPDSYVCFAGRQKALPRLVTWLDTWFPPVPGTGRLARRRLWAGRLCSI